MATKKTSKKAKPSDLGTGAARKAADAIVKRKKAIDKAANGTSTSGQKKKPSVTTKTGPTIDMSNPAAYRKYQLEKAKEDMKKKKAKK